MKKTLFFAAAVMMTLTGCSKSKSAAGAENPAEILADEVEEFADENAVLDFDLTKMGANMVYAQVFNMMLEPEQFKGKVFKIRGNFTEFTSPDGNPGYAVIIADALACCQQGIEFKYDFEQKPSPDEIITVTGKYIVTSLESGAVYSYVKASAVGR